MELGRLRAGSSALSSRPQAESRDAATTDSWTSFLQCYDSLLARELAQEQPQFVRALRQLERDSRLQQERQSAQVLATLRLKDAKISELQRLVSEQSEQLDVVLDELERRETKEDKQVQVDVCRDTEDAAVQTETLERTLVDVETQTEQEEGERGVLLLLQKLERELSAVEQRNVALETQLQLQQRATTSETTERRTEDDERMEACLESLQRGVEAMNLSCGCVENPLAFCVGVPREDNDGKGSFGAMATCVNLEHRLEAQAVRLEHLHECLHVWRDAAVQLMKRQNGCDEVPRSVVPSIPQAVHVAARCDEGEEGAINCSVALRGALKQIRERYNQRSERGYDDEQRVVRDLAQLLAKGKSGVKAAAKMVQKWAGWEASHLEEVRALRQGAAEERAVGVSRRIVLLKRIDELEQRELDLQAELNALRKSMKGHDTRGFISSLPPESCGAELSGADTCDRPIKYPQLMLRLATAEQNLLVKDEQLKAANGTIRALSSCSPTPSSVNHSVAFYSDNDADSLAVEVQRSLQQKLEFFRKREKDLVNLGQYFRMEKVCLQLKSRLDAEQKHAAMLQAALQVCERERDELLMQVEKLESEAMLARITCEAAASRPSPVDRSFSVDTDANDTQSYVFFMLRRLRLVEDDNKNLRDRLRQSQQQVALMLRQQLPDDGSEETHIDFTAKELQKCLTKCAELTSQNTKLARRLREEKEANKQYFTATQELQKQLSARTDANLELNHTLKQYQIQTADLLNPSIAGGNMEISLQSSARNVTAVSGIGEKDTNVPNRSSEHEYEDLREQLASREQENLALVQSLCTIKEKCAQMEAVHEKELRVKAAEHAEAMENYMRTVNETLSRIESDKHRLEDENVKLRAKVQQLEAETTRRELEQTQRSSKGTNTDGNTLESAASSREKESLKARVVDLELQLARERKLTEMVEQKQQLENQHEEQQESAAKLEAAKVKQEYEMRCETLKDLRNKLQHEFAEYQVVERASQQESDRRIDFLSTCIEEFVRLADTTAPTIGKNVSTDELYDLVMDLARAPPQVASKNIASSSQLKRQPKRNVPPSQRQKPGNRGQESVTTSRDTSWSDMLIAEERNQDESEMSEAMLWKLRASKMEAYVRSAMLQNDTFEDTIRQLELGLSNVKEELTSRLARETQLVAKLGALKSELATTKEQAASLAEKYQLTNAELEKRQGEVTNRGDETLRARMAVQRKTELLTQQRAKVASLQQELEQAAKKIERLGAAEKQAALLQQKAKEHTQQLLHARQSYERCRDDNVQLSFHLEKLKERHVAVVTRLKAARAENAQLRTQCSDLKNNTNPATPQAGIGMGRKDTHRGNQDEVNAVSIASLTDEARALKRRVLQKQDVIVSYKSKVAEFEAQLERQRDTMVKLARTNRELQQGQRQRQQQEFEFTSALQAKLEGQLEVKQEQLDGLRASVYDSFEAFVFCQAPVPLRSPSSSSTATLDNPLGGDVPEGNDELFDIKRWTDFSVDDLEELRLARGAQQSRTKRERESQQRSNKINKRKAAAAALREVEGALETTPEDCRAQICELLQCLCA
ncbi:hypothetical protein PR003_g13117 [Phytophthora rubi]|uniref:Uncharacterized protein n=1 Tax=Phytophthora rubi TaxID=129364 RepID=A0A6A4F6P1_9STRA|nr:hypothetical protein PR003_g13117 [Phytophthora rubi]